MSQHLDGDVLLDAASGAGNPAPSPAGDSPEAPSYFSKRKRKLIDWKLRTFREFWSAFNCKKGKAEAADAWLDISGLSLELAGRITEAARKEAAARPALLAKGGAPKWAQGWLSGRRWEDWEDEGEPHNQAGDSGASGIKEDHDPEKSRSRQEKKLQYRQSLRDAVKRFM
jgi:hypothetical protein